MRILFDQGTPVPLREYLSQHQVETTFERGWSTLTNGELLARAEQEGFEIFVTTDQNLIYQQNLGDLKIAIVVLASTSWPHIQPAAATITQALVWPCLVASEKWISHKPRHYVRRERRERHLCKRIQVAFYDCEAGISMPQFRLTGEPPTGQVWQRSV